MKIILYLLIYPDRPSHVGPEMYVSSSCQSIDFYHFKTKGFRTEIYMPRTLTPGAEEPSSPFPWAIV